VPVAPPLTAAAAAGAAAVQFEDPAPGLQRLREKLELDMAAACPWLTQVITVAQTVAVQLLRAMPLRASGCHG
jgi:hypothetical protein